MNGEDLEKILERVRRLPDELSRFREMLLANVAMITEIPAPTFAEQDRIAFLEQRFNECGLQNCSIDEVGNGSAILPGSEGAGTILLTAHADTPFPASINHTCTIDFERIIGPGVADNSLGLAVLATLPSILEGLKIRFRSDLLLLGAVHSLDAGNQQGLRFFLANSEHALTTCISIEGVPLGRLRFRSMASFGAVISCHVDRKLSRISAIDVLNQIILRLRDMKLQEQTNTELVLGVIEGGILYKVAARNARLKFQLRSDSDQSVMEISDEITGILDEVNRQIGISAHMNVIVRTRYGGLDSSHPLVSMARRVMRIQGIHLRNSIHSSVVSGYVEQDIPALCIGITNGENLNDTDEFVEIEPIMRGLAQLIGILLAIDGGYCG